MELIVAALVAGGFLGLTAHLVRRGRRARAPVEGTADLTAREADPDRGWSELRPQDVLIVDGHDYIVRTAAVFRESSRRWQECRLDDEGAYAWLCVEDDDSTVRLGWTVEVPGVGSEPPELLDHEGKVFRLASCGQASVGRDDDAQAQDVRYWDYARPGADRLWVRQPAGGALQVRAGRAIQRHLFELLPGPD
ncbi:MAG: hypothetical protein CSA65_08665 [Proteobacteria bacterium]|nr:MAG: hypothetical protein CSB49_07055 [Pseudomonadota bacterium]PIE17529.1 MAG: hypothetical protein CSA65_08665 [Pseudomonadota bacterium]